MPKVDPALINDLLFHQMENPSVTPLYMVEIFTKYGTNPEQGRIIIREKIGMNPAIYDNSNHFVITQKLTMEKLNAISEFDEVLEITGKYIGGLEGGYGTSSDLTDMNENENEKKEPLATSSATVAAEQSSLQSVVQVQRNQEKDVRQYPKSQRKQQQQKSKYQIAIFTAIGIVGAIALTGFIPNVNQNNASPATQTTSTTGAVLTPGALHGYVAGPTGFPAIGAANQETGYTENAIISINGQYFLNNLPAGEYIVMVAYPDGKNKVVNDFQIESGSSHKLDFSY